MCAKPKGATISPLRSDGPNILMVMSDQHRADWMGCAGADWVQTPNLDALAERGAMFSNCRTNSPLCAPARAALASTKRCSEVGSLSNGHLYPYDEPTYYQQLRAAGYRVGCVGKTDLHKPDHWEGLNGDRPLMHHLGFTDPKETEGKMSAGRRYDRLVCPYQKYLDDHGLLADFIEDYEMRGEKPVCYAADSVLPTHAYHDDFVGRSACEFLQNVGDENPWHYFVSFVGPHDPFDAPTEYAERYRDAPMPDPIEDTLQGKPAYHRERHEAEWAGADAECLADCMRQYSAMVSLIDHHVGQMVEVLEARGMLDNTVIIYCADHGEMLGDHSFFRKAVFYESAVRVPLIIAGPGIEPIGQSEALVELNDAAATCLDLAETEPLPGASASSLMPILSDERDEHRQYQISELLDWRMICDGRYKYIQRPGDMEQLYDLQEDPDELNNLVNDAPDRVRAMRERLEAEVGKPPEME
ncbi:MAG: sulfatase [Armatimonadota bacterium]